MEPARCFGKCRDYWLFVRGLRHREVPEQAGLSQLWLTVIGDLHGEEAFVYDLTESIDNPSTVEVNPSRLFMLK